MINMADFLWQVWPLQMIQKYLEKIDTKLVSYKYRLKHKAVTETQTLIFDLHRLLSTNVWFFSTVFVTLLNVSYQRDLYFTFSNGISRIFLSNINCLVQVISFSIFLYELVIKVSPFHTAPDVIWKHKINIELLSKFHFKKLKTEFSIFILKIEFP